MPCDHIISKVLVIKMLSLWIDCPEEVNVAMIIGLVVAGIVLIPLLALCIFIFIRNRRDAAEYAEFLREKERTKWETVSSVHFHTLWHQGGKRWVKDCK